jgi:hypothetical protein
MIGIKKILKGLLIREENTLTPKEIEILPGGTAGTKTTLTSSQTSNLTFTLPSTTGTNGQLIQTDGSGNLSFVSSSGSNTTLSNLTSPTAINQDLIFNKLTPIVKSADASAATESVTLTTGVVTGAFASGTLNINTGNANSAGGTGGAINILTGFGNLSSGNVSIKSNTASTGGSGTMAFESGNTTSNSPSGALTIKSGNTTGTNAASGSIQMTTGTTQGAISGGSGLINIATGFTTNQVSGAVTVTSGSTSSTAGTGALTLSTGASTANSSANTGAITITSGNYTNASATAQSGLVTIKSGNTTGQGASGNVSITTGTVVANRNSGSILLSTAAVSGSGVRGTINLTDASLATASVGHVWTLTNTTTGAGNWAAPGGGGGILSKVTASNASMGSTVTDEVITGLTFAHASFNGCFIDYRIKKGTLVRNGRILVSTDGTTVAFNDTFVETVLSTVVFEAVVNGANINIRHTNTETGTMTISFEQSRFPV